MATTEHISLLSQFDEDGNRKLIYPVTSTEAVDGLEEFVKENSPSGGGVSSWNDLTDKPFGEVSGRNTITLAANLTGFHNAEYGEWFKVSDSVVTETDISPEAVITWFSDGIVQYSDAMPWIGRDGYIGVSILEQGTSNMPEVAQFRSSGVFFRKVQGASSDIYPIAITLPGYGKFAANKPIDAKYLPESLQFGEVPGSDTWQKSGNIVEQATDVIDGYYYKISDAIVTKEDFALGYTLRVNKGGVVGEEVSYNNAFVAELENGVAVITFTDKNGFPITTVYCYPEGLDHDPGIYVRYVGDDDCVESLTINGFTGFTVSKTIDPKYLPETNGGGAGVSSWNDLTDRPFGVVGGRNTITWAGNPGGLTGAPVGRRVKVSDAVITEADIKEGANVSWISHGVYYASEDESYFHYRAYDDGTILVWCSDGETGNDYPLVEFRPNGVYFNKYDEDNYPISVTLPGFGKFTTVKTIDAEYLPKALRLGEVSGSNTWVRGGNFLDSVTDATKDNFFKISDAIVTMDDLASGFTMKYSRMGEELTWTPWENDALLHPSGFIEIPFYDQEDWIGGVRCYPEGLDHDPGVYVAYYPPYEQDGVIYEDGVVSFTIPGFTKFTSVQTLNQNYLPEALQFGDVPGNDSVSWDGNGECVIVDEWYQFYRVSDVVVTEADLANGFSVTCKGYFGNPDEEITLSLADGYFIITTNVDGSFYITGLNDFGDFTEYVVMVCSEGCSYPKGVYFAKNGGYYETTLVTNLTIPGFGKFTTQKCIDQKYLPKAEPVSDATGSTVTAEEFNALLAALRAAGYLAQ